MRVGVRGSVCDCDYTLPHQRFCCAFIHSFNDYIVSVTNKQNANNPNGWRRHQSSAWHRKYKLTKMHLYCLIWVCEASVDGFPLKTLSHNTFIITITPTVVKRTEEAITQERKNERKRCERMGIFSFMTSLAKESHSWFSFSLFHLCKYA